jgi:hypothetical protein
MSFADGLLSSEARLVAWLNRTVRETWWAVIGVLTFWAVAAKVFHVYLLYPWLDRPSHFAGGCAIAFAGRRGVVNAAPTIGSTPLLVQSVLAVGVAAVAAITWEFLGYLSDLYLHTRLVLGETDTLSDLFFGLSGATAYAIYAYISERRQRL